MAFALLGFHIASVRISVGVCYSDSSNCPNYHWLASRESWLGRGKTGFRWRNVPENIGNHYWFNEYWKLKMKNFENLSIQWCHQCQCVRHKLRLSDNGLLQYFFCHIQWKLSLKLTPFHLFDPSLFHQMICFNRIVQKFQQGQLPFKKFPENLSKKSKGPFHARTCLNY